MKVPNPESRIQDPNSEESAAVHGSDIVVMAILFLIGCGTSGAVDRPPAAEAAGKPEAKLSVSFPPAAERQEKEPPSASREDYASRRQLQIPLDRARLAGKRGAEIWITSDLGQTWTNHGEIDLGKPSAGFLAPRDGRYGFLLVPLGADGRRDFTPKVGDAPERTVVVDTVPPVVEVLSPNGGEVFGAGRSTVILWFAQDANMDPKGIRIEASTGGAEGWTTIAKDLPNTGNYHWDINLPSATTYRIRVVAKDLAGNEGKDASDNVFTIDGQPPDLRIAGPASANAVPVRIEWTGGDVGGAGLKRVSLYVTRDRGQTWTRYGDADDLKSPILFQDLDGVYGLRLVGEDRVGNANPIPAPGTVPQFTMVLDRTRPEVKLLSPKAGGFLGGVPVDIRWTAQDNIDMPSNGIALSYSDDGGKSWKEIAKGLKNDGLYRWTPPRTPGADYRVKITASDFAGNVAEAVSDRFGIDVEAPMALATGPERSKSHTVHVTYEIKNRGSAPIRKVTLYYRPENVREWIPYGDDPDAQSPFLFAKADGKYGIYLTCATEQGLAGGVGQRPPEKDTDPQLTLTIDATPPQIWLESFGGGGYVQAGATVPILWKMVEANPDPKGLAIYHSPDGGSTWNFVAGRLDPTKGSYPWTIPSVGGSRHKLRLVATDLFGNPGQAESERPFTIDNDLPVVTIAEKPPAAVRASRISFRYKAADATSGVQRVVVHAKPFGGREPYKQVAQTENPDGMIECALPGEGYWALLVVAVDGAGHLSADPAKDTKPDFVTAVDRTPPEIKLKDSALPTGAKTYVNSAWEIEWRATDAISPPEKIGVRVEYSPDGGKTWPVAVQKAASSGRADMRKFFTAGKKYRVRVVATDEAGNEGEDVSTDFDPGDLPPPALVLLGIEDGRQYVVGGALALMWSSPDKSIREAELEISPDGGRTWTLFAQMSTSSMRVTLPEKEGRHHLRAVARDSSARSIRSNTIMFETVAGVERVQIITHATVEAGATMAAAIEPKTIVRTAKELRLEISENGKDWRLVRAVNAAYVTFPAPLVPGDYWLKVAVKMEGREYDSNHARFRVAIDSTRPRVSVTGPTAESPAPVTLEVKTEPSISPLKELMLFVSQDGGRTWKLHGTQPAAKPVSFAPERPGDYGVYLVARSEAGLMGEPPGPGARPQAVIKVRAKAALAPAGPLALLTSLGGAVKGGSKLELRWSSQDPAGRVAISVVIDGKATILAKDQPASGSVTWEVPRVDARSCQVLLEMGDQRFPSESFEIRSTPPRIEGVDLELPRR